MFCFSDFNGLISIKLKPIIHLRAHFRRRGKSKTLQFNRIRMASIKNRGSSSSSTNERTFKTKRKIAFKLSFEKSTNLPTAYTHITSHHAHIQIDSSSIKFDRIFVILWTRMRSRRRRRGNADGESTPWPFDLTGQEHNKLSIYKKYKPKPFCWQLKKCVKIFCWNEFQLRGYSLRVYFVATIHNPQSTFKIKKFIFEACLIGENVFVFISLKSLKWESPEKYFMIKSFN